MENKKKQFIIYLVVAFTVAYAIEITSSILAYGGNTTVFSILNAIAMLVPMFAVFVARADLRHMGWKANFDGKKKYYLLAFFGPYVLFIIGAVLFYAVFPKAFDPSGSYIRAAVGKEIYDQLLAGGITPAVYVVISSIQAITYAPILNGILAMGEEIGWRGYMYPYLKERFGINKGRIIGGVIWGLWHWPLIIIAGYEYGTQYLGAPFTGPVLFLVITTVWGICLDWLYEKTECIYVPAIGHGAINAVAGIPLLLINEDYLTYSVLGPSGIGILSAVPIVILAVIICAGKKSCVRSEE